MAQFGGKTARIIMLGMIVICAGLVWGSCRFIPGRLSVCEVQGTGEISDFVGKNVVIQGVVSAVVDQDLPRGFFLIDQQCPDDEGGSRGIFVEVATSGGLIHPGDEVRINGLVEEVGGETRVNCDPNEIEILSLGNDLPQAINLTEEYFLHSSSFQYEDWEGMLVSFQEGEYLGGFQLSDLPRLQPVFYLDPGLQMVCLQNESIALQISCPRDTPGFSNMSNGDLVENLSGILRQNAIGYILELVSDSTFKKVKINTSRNLTGWSTSLEIDSNTTQLPDTPGTPVATTSSTISSTPIPSVTIIPTMTYYPVNVLISELCPNPASKEPDGEWVEIYNPETYAQPLTGVKLGDETSSTGKEGMLRFPDGYYIEGREVLVIAHQARTFFSAYGFLPDFEMNDSDSRVPDLLPYAPWGRSGIQFSNSGDEVLLLDPWDGVVDLLAYGKSTASRFSDPPSVPKESHSLERYPPDRDRDTGGDWRERQEVSPGRLDLSPPTQAVLPTQVPSSTFTPSPQISPSGTASRTPTGFATPMWTVSSTPTVELTPSLSPTVSVTATTTVTPERSLMPTPSQAPSPLPPSTSTEVVEITQTPSVSASSTLTCTPLLTSSPSATGTSLPELTATSTGTVTDTPQSSMTPSPDLTATATTAYLEDPDILLNEIHADPDPVMGDANNDGLVHSDDDEFLEFVNTGEVDLDLSGWKIADSIKVRYEFSEGSILKSGWGMVIFGGGTPQGNFGCSLVFTAGSLGLNNAGDAISLLDEAGKQKLSYVYGPEGGNNQSITRSPDISGDFPLVPHSEVIGSDGSLYSPGFTVDGNKFGSCP